MKPKYKVHLCRGCIESLEEFYPYMIPKEDLDITEVSVDKCDNSDLDNYDRKLAERNPCWEGK